MYILGISIYAWLILFVFLSIGSIGTAIYLIRMLRDINKR